MDVPVRSPRLILYVYIAGSYILEISAIFKMHNYLPSFLKEYLPELENLKKYLSPETYNGHIIKDIDIDIVYQY